MRKTGMLLGVLALRLLQAGLQPMPAAGAGSISFGAGNDVGASADHVYSIAVGDLDNDGDLDIVSGGNTDEDYEVIVWQNDGTPFSGLWTQNDVGGRTHAVRSVAVGDVDNDGDLDIVTGDAEGEVHVWLNDGSPFSGTWSSNEAGDLTWGSMVALGDLDNDGDLDIACGADVSEDYEVAVLQNDGSPFTGTWTQNEVGASAASVNSVALGDFDDDGDLDLVSGGSTDEDYEVIAWQNDGTPFAGTWTQNDVGALDATVQSVAVGDLDDDGDLDIVSGNTWQGPNEVVVWENDGTPFSGLWSSNGVLMGSQIESVAVGDFDNDGDPDIAASPDMEVGSGGHEVLVLWNGGTTFTHYWSASGMGSGNGPVYAVAVGDLDNDGDLDIVRGSHSEEDYEIAAYPNEMAHRGLPSIFPDNAVGTSTDHVYGVAAGDLDDDGDPDLVSGSTYGEDYEVIAWQNDRTPFVGTWAQNDAGVTHSLYSVALGDLDNDGDLDMVTGGNVNADYEVIVWQNDGSPFSGTWTSNNVGTSTSTVWDVAVGDLDNDGNLDIATASGSGENYEVIAWQNDGTPFSGSWTQNDVGASIASVFSLALGDLDNDGDLDVVSGSDSGENYEVIAWQNNGTPFSGTWTQNDVGASNAYVYSVAMGDLDNDGDPDVVSGSGSGEDYEVIAWQNDGTPFTGTWTGNDVGISSHTVYCVVLGDLDNDGDLDVVSGSTGGSDSEVVIWESDGTPFSGLWAETLVGTGGSHLYSVALGDLDSNGDLDVVTGSADLADYEIMAWRNGLSPSIYVSLILKND